MTARNGSAEWHGSVERGSGGITVSNRVFESAYSYESRFVSHTLAGIPEIVVTAKRRIADSTDVPARSER